MVEFIPQISLSPKSVCPPNQFVPEIVIPLPCSPALVCHTLLIVYFFKDLISFIGSLYKCRTSIFIALIFCGENYLTYLVCCGRGGAAYFTDLYFHIFITTVRRKYLLACQRHNLVLIKKKKDFENIKFYGGQKDKMRVRNFFRHHPLFYPYSLFLCQS